MQIQANLDAIGEMSSSMGSSGQYVYDATSMAAPPSISIYGFDIVIRAGHDRVAVLDHARRVGHSCTVATVFPVTIEHTFGFVSSSQHQHRYLALTRPSKDAPSADFAVSHLVASSDDREELLMLQRRAGNAIQVVATVDAEDC